MVVCVWFLDGDGGTFKKPLILKTFTKAKVLSSICEVEFFYNTLQKGTTFFFLSLQFCGTTITVI